MSTNVTYAADNPACTLCNSPAPTGPPTTPMRTVRAAPGTPCPRCGARHRRWHVLVDCLWPRAVWIAGDPPPGRPCFAVVSHCHLGCTVTLHPDLAAARQSKGLIDATGCGSRCRRAAGHEVVCLAKSGPGS